VLGVERSSTGIPVALHATLGRDPAYVGDAKISLPEFERTRFWQRVEKMGAPQARLAGLTKRRKATWIKEGLVARVRHLKGEGKLRHATLQSLGVSRPASEDVEDRHGDE
jgi:bifunctional non-homologous end joining protein LigD